MTEQEDIYAEIWRMARTLLSKADVRTKSLRLEKTDLPTLYSLRMGSNKQGNSDMAMLISLEIVRRESDNARKDHGSKAHAKAVLALVSMLRQTAGSAKGTASAARAMSAGLVAGLTSQPEWLKRYLKFAPEAAKARDVASLTGLSFEDWNAFAGRVAEATSRRAAGALSPYGEPGPVDLNVAARLSRMGARDQTSAREVPSYDLSDRSIKIARVSVTGFRGSARAVSLDFTKNGKPADVLLWGDNGVGKSTLIDGIEFALQHRVDRSADFNSSLRPAVRNLAVPTALAEVELSDGQLISRSLITNAAGRDEPSDLTVRPGFRIAPVVIRRADILRFLDTDALSRGTVFFDYFPDPAGTLGVRPDEELHQLEEERFLLRVARDDLAAQLKEKYPDSHTDFSNAAKLEAFLSELLPADHTTTTTYEHPIEALPDDVRSIVTELQNAQRRGALIKKKLERGVETLNPVAYRSQLDRVVPILQTVTEDLTASFKRIARADHVRAIRVLVAKSGPVSLDVVVEFDNGTSALPQQAFSEGYKDLVALLFFLTVTRKAAEFGQAKVLVLDDALQSVDASIRLGVMDYLLDEFKDWQVIVTGHDRAWFAQLRGLFQRRGRSFVERNIVGWSFANGIEVAGGSLNRADSLRAAIDRVDERAVASGTGLLLEEIASELSWRLMASVTRREGDRYTLGDLWPSVAKALKRTALRTAVEEIDLRLDIRNLLGAHYNEWADGIPWSDIRLLGQDTLAVYDATHCTICGGWVDKTRAQIVCPCGQTVL
jgi:recombinational DNA repair ATPase RecF